MSARQIEWEDGPIDGLEIRNLTRFKDGRGWLAEFFRGDELSESNHPAMGYLSLTRSGVSRGPHEHVHQTDLFLFFSGSFRLYAWDARDDSPTYRRRLREDLGEDRLASVIVPPGVVHAYRNVGTGDAYIINCPNRLYAGRNRQESVDEIRYEDLADSPFALD